MDYRECDAREGKRWLDAVSFSWVDGGMDGGDRVFVGGGGGADGRMGNVYQAGFGIKQRRGRW